MFIYQTSLRDQYYEKAVDLYYREGLSVRRIAKIIPASKTTVMRWIANFAEDNPHKAPIMKKRSIKPAPQIEQEPVSEETGIRNGIDFIRPKYDRKDSRQQKEANTIRNLEFDRQQIHGHWIILIDVVTTRGTSFVQCVNKLYACGAKYVCGFFMGKTVDL